MGCFWSDNDSGIFDLKLLKGKNKDLKFWICLAICMVLRGPIRNKHECQFNKWGVQKDQ
jgi:hypothetical protein